MTNTTRLLATVAALALFSPAALAEEGFYLGGNLGAGFPEDAEYSDGTSSNSVDSKVGFTGIASAGYQFDNNWRFQGEFGARLGTVDSITGAGAGPANTGDIDVYSLMADAIYNVPTGTRFEPYIGAGAGVAWVRAHDVADLFATPTTISDTDTVLAYQGIAGLEYKINPALRANLDYRYFRTADTSFSTSVGSADGEYSDHSITLGLRYLFLPAAAPLAEESPRAYVAPASPPPPPQVPNNYIVFFDFDKSNVTPEASRILSAAAQNAQQAGAEKVEVTGHADRAGSDKYNLALSKKRAEAVKTDLTGLGIAANKVTTAAKGESEPLVATKDGVREPQNRRVQIILK